MVDIIQPNAAELAQLETRRRLAAARSTSEWLDVFQETVESGVNTALGGTSLEALSLWRTDWKVVRIELKAIGLSVLDEVEIENSPVAIPGAPAYCPGLPTKIYWHADNGKEESISLSNQRARIATNFFVWMASFQDTLQIAKQNRATAEDNGIMRAGLTIDAKRAQTEAQRAEAERKGIITTGLGA